MSLLNYISRIVKGISGQVKTFIPQPSVSVVLSAAFSADSSSIIWGRTLSAGKYHRLNSSLLLIRNDRQRKSQPGCLKGNTRKIKNITRNQTIYSGDFLLFMSSNSKSSDSLITIILVDMFEGLYLITLHTVLKCLRI